MKIDITNKEAPGGEALNIQKIFEGKVEQDGVINPGEDFEVELVGDTVVRLQPGGPADTAVDKPADPQSEGSETEGEPTPGHLVSDEQLEKLLAASPAPRVTKEYIESRITRPEYTRLSQTVTICTLTLDNGFSVRGESACVNPENYNQEIGERISFDNAFRQLWPLFGFLLAEKNFLAKEAR